MISKLMELLTIIGENYNVSIVFVIAFSFILWRLRGVCLFALLFGMLIIFNFWELPLFVPSWHFKLIVCMFAFVGFYEVFRGKR